MANNNIAVATWAATMRMVNALFSAARSALVAKMAWHSSRSSLMSAFTSAPQPVDLRLHLGPQPVELVPQPVELVPQPVELVPQPVELVPQPVELVPQILEIAAQFPELAAQFLEILLANRVASGAVDRVDDGLGVRGLDASRFQVGDSCRGVDCESHNATVQPKATLVKRRDEDCGGAGAPDALQRSVLTGGGQNAHPCPRRADAPSPRLAGAATGPPDGFQASHR